MSTNKHQMRVELKSTTGAVLNYTFVDGTHLNNWQLIEAFGKVFDGRGAYPGDTITFQKIEPPKPRGRLFNND